MTQGNGQISNHRASKAGDVMYYENAATKHITFINNTGNTIYPVLRAANANEIYSYPSDPVNREYRAYIGYQQADGQRYLGLKPAHAITVPVPQAFWDAGTHHLATVNPLSQGVFHHDKNALQFVVETPETPGGLLLLYRADQASNFGPDAPSQFFEPTFRDPSLKKAAPSEQATFIDYDVSYVDNMLLPVALEASLPDKTAVGYIGSGMPVEAMQHLIQDFVSGKLLGNYFGGRGWPQYYQPDTSATGIKIPSGYHVFSDSPLKNGRSSYDQNKYLLTSGSQTEDDIVSNLTSRWFAWAKYHYDISKGTVPAIRLSEQVQNFDLHIDNSQRAAVFAKTVYEVIQGFSSAMPGVNKAADLIQYIIGFTPAPTVSVDKIQHLNGPVQSLLRGVTDYKDASQRLWWYPDPAGTDAKYNLDPFVWFVHSKLGMTGYGFSIDDAVGNFQVPNASHLYVSIGGLGSLPNKQPYKNQ